MKIHKNLFYLLLGGIIASTSSLYAQDTIGLAISATDTVPHASSILDITSTSKGVLIPRMTTTQKAAITSPADGLMVYDTDKKGLYLYDGTASKWKMMGDSVWTRNGGDIYYNAGNIGIGTTTPGSNTHIYAGASGGSTHQLARLTVEDDDFAMISILTPNDRKGYFAFADANDDYVGGMTYDHQTDKLELFTANRAPADLVLNSDGNVGIGTSSPDVYNFAGGNKYFTVQPNTTNVHAVINIIGNGTGAGAINFGNESIRRASIGGWDGSNIIFYTNPTNSGTSLSERMRITSGGKVGIGTTSPNQLQHIHSGSAATSMLQFTNSTSGTTSSDGMLVGISSNDVAYITQRENADLRLKTNDLDRLTITGSGDVGVGTSSPSASLHINGNGTGTGKAFYVQDATGAVDGLTVLDNGRVGIGTSVANSQLTISSGSLHGVSVTSAVTGTTFMATITNTSDGGGLDISTNSNYQYALNVSNTASTAIKAKTSNSIDATGIGVYGEAVTGRGAVGGYSGSGGTGVEGYCGSASSNGYAINARLWGANNIGFKIQNIAAPNTNQAFDSDMSVALTANNSKVTNRFYRGGGGTFLYSADHVRIEQASTETGNVFHVLAGSNEALTITSSGNTGIGTNNPNANSLVELASTSQAFLIMRMTSSQAGSITPANGMMLYVTDTDTTFTSVGFWGYENGSWVKL